VKKSTDLRRQLSKATTFGWEQRDELTAEEAMLVALEPVYLEHELARGGSRSDTSWTRILYQDLFSAVAANDGMVEP